MCHKKKCYLTWIASCGVRIVSSISTVFCGLLSVRATKRKRLPPLRAQTAAESKRMPPLKAQKGTKSQRIPPLKAQNAKIEAPKAKMEAEKLK